MEHAASLLLNGASTAHCLVLPRSTASLIAAATASPTSSSSNATAAAEISASLYSPPNTNAASVAHQVMSLASIMMPGCSLPSSMGPSTTTSSLLPTSPSSTSSSEKTRPAAASSPRGSAATAEQMERPSLSYKDLIIEAIESSKEKRLKLNEIYQVIRVLHPYYRMRPDQWGWQNSIRHNLSLHDCFVKLPLKQTSASGVVGHYWTVVPELSEKQTLRRRNRTAARGSGGARVARSSGGSSSSARQSDESCCVHGAGSGSLGDAPSPSSASSSSVSPAILAADAMMLTLPKPRPSYGGLTSLNTASSALSAQSSTASMISLVDLNQDHVSAYAQQLILSMMYQQGLFNLQGSLPAGSLIEPISPASMPNLLNPLLTLSQLAPTSSVKQETFLL